MADPAPAFDIAGADVLAALPHGFCGHSGGTRQFGYGGEGAEAAIRADRAAAAQAILPGGVLVAAHQVHSPDVIVVDAAWDDAAQGRPVADALVTATPGLVLGVVTADCAPVLLADAEAGVIGAAHAGWRGAVDGILEATLDAMEALGARRGAIAAVIGPTISQAAYEVGPEFFDRFRAEDEASTRFFAQGPGDRLLFDLPGYGLHRLRQAGVGRADWTGHCTYRDPARFYSFRRTTHAGEADYGRLISTIRL